MQNYGHGDPNKWHVSVNHGTGEANLCIAVEERLPQKRYLVHIAQGLTHGGGEIPGPGHETSITFLVVKSVLAADRCPSPNRYTVILLDRSF